MLNAALLAIQPFQFPPLRAYWYQKYSPLISVWCQPTTPYPTRKFHLHANPRNDSYRGWRVSLSNRGVLLTRAHYLWASLPRETDISKPSGSASMHGLVCWTPKQFKNSTVVMLASTKYFTLRLQMIKIQWLHPQYLAGLVDESLLLFCLV